MKKDLPIVNVLKIVPITANNNIVPKWSKKSLLGIKQPASKMMGGSIYRKNVSGVNGDICTLSVVWNNNTPITTPTTISRHDSGKIEDNFGVIWKPEKKTLFKIIK